MAEQRPDHVVLAGAEGERMLDIAQFMALPAAERVRHLAAGRVRFFCAGREMTPNMALSSLEPPTRAARRSRRGAGSDRRSR